MYHRALVSIDGKDAVSLRLAYHRPGNYQYNTPGNVSAHCFSEPLREGDAFRVSGHRYVVLKVFDGYLRDA